MPVKSIPDGFHTLTPHLYVRGGGDAIEFYKKAFGATEISRMLCPDGKSLMHAAIQIGDSKMFLVDENPQWGVNSPLALGGTPLTLHLYVSDVDAAFARAVAAGATAIMPVTDMFWGDRYGKVRDPFGHEWSIATHKEDVTPEQLQQRGAEMFSKPRSEDCKPK